MVKMAHEGTSLTRLAEYCRELEWLHLWGDDERIDREFNAICRKVWGYTLDDFDDDQLSPADHKWLDALTQKRAASFAIENGYDFADYYNGGIITDWWGFAWMVLAEKRGLFTPEQRAAAWSKHDARLLAQATNVIGVIRAK